MSDVFYFYDPKQQLKVQIGRETFGPFDNLKAASAFVCEKRPALAPKPIAVPTEVPPKCLDL